jgi:hypothetical protein
VRCVRVTWRIVPSSRDSGLRRSRSIRPLTARSRAANGSLMPFDIERVISALRAMRRMHAFCDSNSHQRIQRFCLRNFRGSMPRCRSSDDPDCARCAARADRALISQRPLDYRSRRSRAPVGQRGRGCIGRVRPAQPLAKRSSSPAKPATPSLRFTRTRRSSNGSLGRARPSRVVVAPRKPARRTAAITRASYRPDG